MTDFEMMKKLFSPWLEKNDGSVIICNVSHHCKFVPCIEVDSPHSDDGLLFYFDENGRLTEFE